MRETRGGRRRRRCEPNVRPVERVELNEKKVVWRIAAVAACVIVAVVSFSYGVSKLMGKEAGFAEIKANPTAEASCSTEMTFFYEIGRRGGSNSAEFKQVTKDYTQICTDAYKLFSAEEAFEDCRNPAYLSRHPNEDVRVGPELYKALERMVSLGGRRLYAAPICELYKGIFNCTTDGELQHFDPDLNAEVCAQLESLCTFINSGDHINLELLGNDEVRLQVSQEYLEYAKVNDVDAFLGFGWARNAAIADYVGDEMVRKGHTLGFVSSYDGFLRSFGDNRVTYDHYDGRGGAKKAVAAVDFRGEVSLAFLHNFPLCDLDFLRTYVTAENRVINDYIDPADGRCKNALNGLTVYSKSASCLETALIGASAYIADSFDRASLAKGGGVYFLYVDGEKLMASGKGGEAAQRAGTEMRTDMTVEYVESGRYALSANFTDFI